MTHPVVPSSRPTHAAATRPALRAAAAFGLSAALAVGGAGGAFAASGHSRDAGHRDEGHSSASSHGSRGQGRARTSGEASSHSSSAHRSASTDHSTHRRASDASPTPSRRSTDPKGNNGTIKIDGPAYDTRVDNEPHPGCAFRVTFFGFDAGQTADITITGIAPTGGGVLLHDTAVPTSDDAAGGAAKDADGATRVYTADDLGLAAVTPHPKQGYHLKVVVDSREAPGGAKQKVLWLAPCEEQPSVATAASRRSLALSAGTSVSPGAMSGTTSGTTSGTSTGPSSGTAAAPAPAAAPADVAGVSAASAPAERSPQGADQVLGASSNRSGSSAAQAQAASALPAVAGTTLASLAFTGASGVVLLLALGLGAVALGAALRLAARRRAVVRA